MRFELAITLRYFLSRDRERSLSLITSLAVGGVTLGVAALVVALSVMNGYQANMVRAMAGALPHLSVLPPEGKGLAELNDLAAKLEKRVHVKSAAPFLLQEALVSNPARPESATQGVMLRGVDPAAEAGVPDFLAFLKADVPDWDRLPVAERLARAAKLLETLDQAPEPGVFPVLLSPMLAEKLHVKPGDDLLPLVFPRHGEGFSPYPAQGRLRVAGYFQTGILAFDELVILIHVRRIESIYPGSERNASLGLRLDNPLDATAVAAQLRLHGGEDDTPFSVYSWIESNRGLFQVIRVQKAMLFIVLMLIVVIAFFGMIGALVMLVIDKSREIAVLKSVGAGDASIRRIFLVQGVLIGAVGTALGLALGLGLCFLLDAFPLIEIPAGVYPGSDRIPVRVEWPDLVAVVLGTMAVSFAATLYPARKASKLTPVEGFRIG
jgi:lipoprotein-releasing system permease protein